MINSDILINDFYQKHKEFSFLKSMNLECNINEKGYPSYSLNMLLCDYPFCDDLCMLHINFKNIKNFKLGNIEGLYRLLVSIVDISDNQMENINFKIKEDENEMFSFYCDVFDYDIINARLSSLKTNDC